MMPTCSTGLKDSKRVYDRAVAYAGPDPSLPPPSRKPHDDSTNTPSSRSCAGVCALRGHVSPMHTLCERVERFLPELFVFVARA